MSLKKYLKRVIYTDGMNELPSGVTIIVFFLLLFNAMTTTMVFSYLPRLVMTFGYTEVEKGTYVGYVASAMFVSSTLCSFLWGWFADMKGKKLAVLLTSTGAGLSSLALGFSKNIYWAIVSRFLQGVFGLQVTTQAFMFSICDETNKALVMTISLSAYSAGLVLGPSVGGFLAFPAEQYPTLFSKGSLFARFNILLPNIILSCGYLLLTSLFFVVAKNDRLNHQTQSESHESLVKELPQENSINSQPSQPLIKRGKLYRLFTNKLCLLSCVTYALFQISAIGFNELYPVWASTTREYHGLELTTSQIGTSLMIAAAFLIFVQPIFLSRVFIGSLLAQIFLYPSYPPIAYIKSKYGMWSVLCFDIILTRMAVGASFLGVSVIINDAVESDLIGAANGLGITLGGCGRTLTRLSVDDRVISPTAFGHLYSWCILQIRDVPGNKHPYGFPLNQYFPFIIMALLSMINAYFVTLLPQGHRKNILSKHKQKEICVVGCREEEIDERLNGTINASKNPNVYIDDSERDDDLLVA